MEWTTFFLGVAAGVGGLLAFVSFFAMWWMRPYMKAARERIKLGADTEDGKKELQDRVMQHLYAQEHEKAWGGNNPWKHWTKRKSN